MTAAIKLDELCINTIRTLSMDAVQEANSGHPGTPMALAPVMYTLWERFLRFDPARPDLPSRDRFVLSVGHASMLLYATLHLYGYDVTLDDIKRFRQLGSPCAGHPEFGHCPGVETTTGPLGQGCGNSVGMAIAQKRLAAMYHRPGHELFDWRVFALCGDGDLMEGVSAEAASLAGHLRLDNLVWIYDDNRITIEGSTDLAFTEDVGARFEAYGWAVFRVEDANDVEAVADAIADAVEVADRPSLVIVRSHIGYGSPNKQDDCEAHGAPLGEDEIRKTKAFYGWDADARFLVPDEVKTAMSGPAARSGAELSAEWDRRLEAYAQAHPELGAEVKALLAGELPPGWDGGLPEFASGGKGVAGRSAFGKALQASAARIPWLIGGSADLGSSNKTQLAGEKSFSADCREGRNLHFGVREHAMGAIANGLSLSGFRAYTGTFLVFSDYMRPTHRLSALMKQPVIYVYTHDSIGVGEDGPTHQPIEHLPSLRAIPGLDVHRPGDANEVVACWRAILAEREHPAALLLSRQDHAVLDRSTFASAEGALRGAYVLADVDDPQVILIGSGSELALVAEAWRRLREDGLRVRAVSMPCWSLFARQDAAYRTAVLPPDVGARVAVEAASGFGWERHVGRDGAIVSHDDFGASAPGAVLFETFGFTVDAVCAAAREQIARHG